MKKTKFGIQVVYAMRITPELWTHA